MPTVAAARTRPAGPDGRERSGPSPSLRARMPSTTNSPVTAGGAPAPTSSRPGDGRDLEAAVEEREHDERQPEGRGRHADEADEAGQRGRRSRPAARPPPRRAAPRPRWSGGRPTVASSIVAGHVLADVVQHRAVGRDRLAEVARASRARKIPYCSWRGRSRPHRARKRATVSGLPDCLSPSWARTGSAGTVCATRKTTRVAAAAIAAEATTLRRTYRRPIRYTAAIVRRERLCSLPPSRPRRRRCRSGRLLRRLHVVEVDLPPGGGQLVAGGSPCWWRRGRRAGSDGCSSPGR